MKNESAPCLGEEIDRILREPESFRCYRRALRCVAEQLVLAVIEFHCGLRSIASRAVNVHQKFAIIAGQFRMRAVRLIILEKLVGGDTENLHGSVVLADCVTNSFHRLYGR